MRRAVPTGEGPSLYGGSDGPSSNPYGTSHIDAQGSLPVDDTTRTAARVRAEGVVRIATALKRGLAARPPAA